MPSAYAPLQNDTFLRACLRQATDHTPVWLMRQAGRYLPEYCATRAKAGSFMGLATNVDYATEVTLQPLERYPLDAAILFSDILTVPDAMGLGMSFAQGEGPSGARRSGRGRTGRARYGQAALRVRRRTAQYFYSHTLVAGSPLEFTAQQRKMVMGFVLLMLLTIAYNLAANTGQDTAVLLFIIAAALLAPYLWGSAMHFRPEPAWKVRSAQQTPWAGLVK
eukprot:gene16927-23234_t